MAIAYPVFFYPSQKSPAQLDLQFWYSTLGRLDTVQSQVAQAPGLLGKSLRPPPICMWAVPMAGDVLAGLQVRSYGSNSKLTSSTYTYVFQFVSCPLRTRNVSLTLVPGLNPVTVKLVFPRKS